MSNVYFSREFKSPAVEDNVAFKVLNPFVPKAPSLYPLKTSENIYQKRYGFLMFSRGREICIGTNGLMRN